MSTPESEQSADNGPPDFSPACPIPISDYPNILLAHGGGGKLMHDLIERLIVPTFSNQLLDNRHDGAVLEIGSEKLAFTTDSYVVKPLFFPGGDIGSLAVCGTVNDLAMCGATPHFLSVGMIIEEGLPTESLWRILQSMKGAADVAGVKLVTGDTKVVDKGKGDGIFINTAGIGVIGADVTISPTQVRTGDAIVLSGDIGRHGIAIMAVREGLEFESEIESDCAPLNGLVTDLMAAGTKIHCMRDLTRGGLASALIEIAESAKAHIHLGDAEIPVREDVLGACEILGFDPLYIANEGRFICFVPPEELGSTLEVFRRHPLGSGAECIGRVTEGGPGLVTMRSAIGATRIVDMLSGEQLPRIC